MKAAHVAVSWGHVQEIRVSRSFFATCRSHESVEHPTSAVKMGYLPQVFFRLLLHFFLNLHIAEFVGVEYLATIQTFDVFNVLFTRYDAYFRVFAGGVHLGGMSRQPVLLGKIVPAGFGLSN